jgi:hypothetical protein
VKDNGDLPFSIDEETVVEAINCVGDAVSEQFFKDHLPINLDQEEKSLPNCIDPETAPPKNLPEEIDSTLVPTCLITPSMNKRRPRTMFYPFDSDMYTYFSSEEEEEGKETVKERKETEGHLKKRSRIEE